MQEMIETLRPSAGDELCVIVDNPLTGPARGDVVLGPVFGATAYSMFPFAYALSRNGFRVLRVDFRCHVGLSSGTIEDMLLSRQAADLAAVLETADDPMLATVSLSARPAIRALTMTSHVRGAVLVEPVVNVRSTLLAVIGEDHLHGRFDDLPDTVGVLDYTVKRPFAIDCVQQGLASLQGSIDEVERLAMPLSFVAGDADPWVDLRDVEQVVQAHRATGADGTFVMIPAASHRLNRNPAVAARYIESMTRECLRLSGSDRDVVMPSFDEMLHANGEVRRATRRAAARAGI